MRVLLDTHSLLWLVTDDLRLSDSARATFLDPANELLCSAVIGFEIAVKHSLGKLELAEPPRSFIENRIRNNALTPFPITMAHAVRVAELPYHHRDPFDWIAQDGLTSGSKATPEALSFSCESVMGAL